jgi:uncharacterized HAD superfamily protein
MDYSKMTPAQQMHYSMLRSLGLTQAQYNALGPAAKAKIDQEMKAKTEQHVKQQMEKQTGILLNIKT